MDQSPGSSAPPPADLQSTDSVDVVSEHSPGRIKTILVNLIQPAALAAALLFRGLAPATEPGGSICLEGGGWRSAGF